MLCEGTCVFKGRRTPPIEIVRDFWVEIFHTLRGQLEQLQGSSDRMQRHREAFLRLWRDGPYTELSNSAGITGHQFGSSPLYSLYDTA